MRKTLGVVAGVLVLVVSLLVGVRYIVSSPVAFADRAPSAPEVVVIDAADANAPLGENWMPETVAVCVRQMRANFLRSNPRFASDARLDGKLEAGCVKRLALQAELGREPSLEEYQAR